MKKSRSFPGMYAAAVEKWRGRKVIVLGDMILDEFIFGRTDRVSREAPVVIVRYDGSGYSPGGAANAAQNIQSLGGKAIPIGLAAGDENGSKLRRCLGERGVSTSCIINSPGGDTTTKTRIMAGDFHAQRQQIVRIDRESRKPVKAGTADRLLDRLEKKLKVADAVILSDYDQGCFDGSMIKESIALCRKASVPVIADSRFRIGLFSGVTTATPNEVEASEAAGIGPAEEDSLEKTGRILLRKLRSESILVTRGRFGMALFQPGKKHKNIAVVGSTEATDVTGAGDTVVSAVALTLASGDSMETAMILANIAASAVVMKRGTAVTDIDEILEIMAGVDLPG